MNIWNFNELDETWNVDQNRNTSIWWVDQRNWGLLDQQVGFKQWYWRELLGFRKENT
jgi:hypothetical protein